MQHLLAHVVWLTKDALCTGFCVGWELGGGGGGGGGVVFKFVLFYRLFFDMMLYVMAVEYGIRYYPACRSIGLI